MPIPKKIEYSTIAGRSAYITWRIIDATVSLVRQCGADPDASIIRLVSVSLGP
jgi:hypothetical protein